MRRTFFYRLTLVSLAFFIAAGAEGTSAQAPPAVKIPDALRYKTGYPQPVPPKSPFPKTVPNDLIIKLRPSVSASRLAALRQPDAKELQVGTLRLAATSIRPLYSEKLIARKGTPRLLAAAQSRGLDRVFTLRFDAALSESEFNVKVQQLTQSGEVEYVQRNHLYAIDDVVVDNEANDSAFISQWNLRKVKAPEAWAVTQGDTAVKIGIVDTGIDYTHPDLIPKLYIKAAEDRNQNGTFEPWDYREKRNKLTFALDDNGVTGDFDGIDQDGNGYPDDVTGWDFTDQPFNIDALNGQSDYLFPDADPFDDNSHGTACAGIAAAATNNTIGVAGVAPNCKLVTLRVFTGAGYADDKDIASSLIYAADNGIRVLNLSFGDVIISPIVRDAVMYAYSQGVVMCASAGNAGGDDQHYPSGYDEIISTVATTEFDEITQFSTFGVTVDIGAPGEGIPTTYPFYRNFYTPSFGGTSAAAPHVAGAAALILSLHPEYTAEQVRGVLVSTTDDIDEKGWDHYTGSGRLNILRAVQSVGSPVAKILSPVYDKGASTLASIAVIGTATSPLFKSYELQFKQGTEETGAWQTITAATARQKVGDTLGVWRTDNLPDSAYTLRLVVNEENGRTVEHRMRFFIDRSPPKVSALQVSDCFTDDRHGVLLEFKTDDLAEATIFYRPKTSNAAYIPYLLAGVKRTHFQLLRSGEVQPDTEYSFYVRVKNTASLADSTAAGVFKLRSEVIQPPTFGQNLLRQRPELRLPKGYFFSGANDFNQNGRREVLLNESVPLEGIKYGALKRYEFNSSVSGNSGSQFGVLDSIDLPLIPRSVGDLDGDGRLEVLTQSSGNTIVYSQATPNSSPFSSIKFADTTSRNFWGSRIANTKDTLASSPQQLIARNDTAYFIGTVSSTVSGNTFNRTAVLPNPVKRAKDGTVPAFEEPKCVVQDFDGDGKPEILVGDYDANFYLYEYSGSGEIYNQTWLLQTPFVGGSNSVVSGNFLGNGKKQFIIGSHTNLSQNQTRDYDAPVWNYQCWQASGNNTYEKVWEQSFYNYRPAFFFESATTAGDIDKDGIDELVVAAYPNLYLFKWDAAAQRFAPIWYYPGVGTSEAIISDIDGNGLSELYFSDDFDTFAWEWRNFTGTLAPVGIALEPLGKNSIKLSWQPVPNASQYRIHRSVNDVSYPFGVSQLATTGATTYTDNSVSADNVYVYAVTASGAGGGSDTSVFVFGVPHDLPKLTEATYSAGNLRVKFSELLQDAPLNAGSFIITNGNGAVTLPPSVVYAKSGNEAVLSFRSAPLAAGNYSVRVQNVRDIFGAAIDTAANAKPFSVQATASAGFYITGKKTVSNRQIELTFNKPVDAATAGVLGNYSVSPDGRVSAVSIDNSRNALTLTLDGRPIGALGVKVSVAVSGVKSTDGAVISAEGNTVSFVEVKQDLSSVFTYPNPYRKSVGNEFVTFANLTEKATIQIFTLTGKRIKRIDHSGDTGGARWLLDTDSGEAIATGIYIYRITAEGVPEKVGKLAVVR